MGRWKTVDRYDVRVERWALWNRVPMGMIRFRFQKATSGRRERVDLTVADNEATALVMNKLCFFDDVTMQDGLTQLWRASDGEQ